MRRWCSTPGCCWSAGWCAAPAPGASRCGRPAPGSSPDSVGGLDRPGASTPSWPRSSSGRGERRRAQPPRRRQEAAAACAGGRAGRREAARVLVHASGFKQSPYADTRPAGRRRAWCARAGAGAAARPRSSVAAAQAVALQPGKLRALGWDPFCSGEPGSPPRATDEGASFGRRATTRTPRRRRDLAAHLGGLGLCARPRHPTRTRARPAPAVLDLGGGTGGLAVPLAELGHHVTVVDPSPDALASLSRRSAESGVAERITAVQGDADDPCRHPRWRPRRPRVLPRHARGRRRPPGRRSPRSPRCSLPTATSASSPPSGSPSCSPGFLPGSSPRPERPSTSADGRWGPGDPLPRRFDAPGVTAMVTAAGFTVQRLPRCAPLQRPRALGPRRLRGRPPGRCSSSSRRPAGTPTSAFSGSSVRPCTSSPAAADALAPTGACRRPRRPRRSR